MYRTESETLYWQDQAMEWLPRILGAIAILVIAWILARAAKWAIAKVVDRIPALKRHREAQPGKTVGSLIGDIAFWLILLVGILLAMQPLGLGQVLDPVRELTTNTFAFIPNLVAGGLLFFLGLVIARIVQLAMSRRREAWISPMQYGGASSTCSGRGALARCSARVTTRGANPFWNPLYPSE